MTAAPISQSDQADLWRFYRGRSMLAVFRPGDYLVLEAAHLDQIRIGDVVVFHSPDTDDDTGTIVHRVIAISPEGLTTQGDTNPWPDGVLVTAENLLGRVIALERRGRRRAVWGGRLGLGWARLVRAVRRAQRIGWLRLFQPIGHLPWGLLRASRLPVLLWKPKINRVRFAAKDGYVIKYMCGRRAVARWWPESGGSGGQRPPDHRGCFQCSRPYDLIIFKPEVQK